MRLFDDDQPSRLTVTITKAQRRELDELAERAGRRVPMTKVARVALTEGIRVVRRIMDKEQAEL